MAISLNPDPQISRPIHQIMLVVNGVHVLENLKRDELAAKRGHEFAFMMQPRTLKGATGSTVAPIAIRRAGRARRRARTSFPAETGASR